MYLDLEIVCKYAKLCRLLPKCQVWELGLVQQVPEEKLWHQALRNHVAHACQGCAEF